MGNSMENIRGVCSLPCNDKRKEWKAGSACRRDGAGVLATRPSLLVRWYVVGGGQVQAKWVRDAAAGTAMINALTTTNK